MTDQCQPPAVLAPFEHETLVVSRHEHRQQRFRCRTGTPARQGHRRARVPILRRLLLDEVSASRPQVRAGSFRGNSGANRGQEGFLRNSLVRYSAVQHFHRLSFPEQGRKAKSQTAEHRTCERRSVLPAPECLVSSFSMLTALSGKERRADVQTCDKLFSGTRRAVLEAVRPREIGWWIRSP